MALWSYLKQLAHDVRTQKLRTFLTLFGIVWGTVAVTLLLAFGEGLHKQLIRSTKGLGDNIVICWPSRTSKPYEGVPRGRRIRVTDEDLERVRHEVPQITRISGEYSSGSLKFKVGHKVLLPGVTGATPEFAEMRNIIPEAGGRYVDAPDMGLRRRVIFLGDKLKKDLFGVDAAIGDEVSINGVPFTVIGVMQQKEQDSSYQGRDNDRASMPASTFKALYGRKYVNDFVFQVASREESEPAQKGVIATLAKIHGFDPEDKEAVGMWDTTENLAFLDTFMLGFRLFLGIVGALTLVVGGIGVANIMHVVVEERTKEIGVKMALGAKRRYVVGQFMFETFALTLAGGLVGFAIAAGVCAVFPVQLHEYVGAPEMSLGVTMATTGILGLIAFFSGFFPARTAAALNPVEALRL